MSNRALRISGLALNGKRFLRDISDIHAELDQRSPTTLEEKLFEFVRDNRIHYYPLSSHAWYHSPFIYLNSLGFGFCDDTAAVLAKIYTGFGFESRVVALNGHLVTEVKRKQETAWKMFDADYGVYFWNERGEVASADELSRRPELITKPLRRMRTIFDPYTDKYAHLFTTSHDNQVWMQGPDRIEGARGEIEFELPPEGKLVFPVIADPAPRAIFGYEATRYSNLILVLPKGYRGTVKNVLLLHSITGKGRIRLDEGKVVSVDAKEKYFNRGNIFFETVEVLDSSSDFKIVYYINPVRFVLRDDQNSTTVTVRSCDSLAVGTEQ